MCETSFKVCRKCNETKHLSEFGLDSSQEDKKRSWCKKCVNEGQRKRMDTGAKPSEHSNPNLASFSPRQLIEELKARGYTGELLYTQKIKL